MTRYRGPTLLQEIEKILRRAQLPLSIRMLLDEIEREGNVRIKGGTPKKTISARITEDIRKNKESSAFIRVKRGIYTVRERSIVEYIPPQRVKKYSSEYEKRVLTIPSKSFYELGYFQGIRKDYKYYLDKILNEKTNDLMANFINRQEAEDSFEYKQIVSYVIIKHGDSILRQTRGAQTSVSSYLRGLYSIGFGGHVEYRDALPLLQDSNDFGYLRSVQRELNEELGISYLPNQLKTVGVLNDESVLEGIKHFALIHILDMVTQDFKKNERWINDLQLVNVQSLNCEFEEYEYWSKLCILSFFGKCLPSSYISVKENFSIKHQSAIILIVGHVGSGKTEACTLLEQEFGYTNIRCSQIMQDIIGCGSIEDIGRYQLQENGYKFINKEGGHDQLAQRIIDFMNSNSNEMNRYVLDGLRYPETLRVLQNKLTKPITVIYIDTMNDRLHSNHKNRYSKKYPFCRLYGDRLPSC